MYRQGDVLLIPNESRLCPEKIPAASRAILATGEATGHAHVLEGACALWGNQLFVFEKSELVHEEHDTIPIPTGTYLVVRQVEWDGRHSRNVAD